MCDASALLTTGLEAWGMRPADVDCIVHTHLHHDHVQNDLMFPDAVVRVLRSELEWASGPDCGRPPASWPPLACEARSWRNRGQLKFEKEGVALP